MDMNDVVTLVNTNRGNGKKKSLDRMQLLMEKLDHPEKDLSFVHIAGTNGKGSTAAFISQILIQAQLKTGIFTSPHLEKVNERIQINSQMISDEEFIHVTEKVAARVNEVETEYGERLYSFEILTAVALLYFKQKRCDIVILEAGIGGRLDSTNVIPVPEVAVITSIGMDHTRVLGNSLEKIAEEKAGIIKKDGDIVLPAFDSPLSKVFRSKAESNQAKLHEVRLSKGKDLILTENSSTFSYKRFERLTIKLIGKHQVNNALLAIEASLILKQKGFKISDKHISQGIEKTYWPGRMERIQEKPTIFIDGAHNPEGVNTLRNSIHTLFPDEKLIFLIGMMKDKDYMKMIDKVVPYAKKIYTVSPDPYRGFPPRVVAKDLKKRGIESESFDSILDAVSTLKEIAEKEKVIVFGSLYLIGDIKKYWDK